MSGQPETATQRYYAAESLRIAQSRIMELSQRLVVQRAQVENYRASDLTAARDTYSQLQQTRNDLVSILADARLLLMEVEETQLAAMAGQLQTGLQGFSLMSNTYRPVYDVLRDFAGKLPVDGTTNARVVGRLMNNIKLGYYPTDPDNISLILNGVQFPEGVTTNLLDPCCGCGKALRQIAQGNNCYAYGVELDESRAEEAQTRLHRVGFGSYFYSRISHEAFHLLFLNPPYLSVLNESGGRARHEKKFLIESLHHLVFGGLLVYVIPYYRLTLDICRILCDNFDDLTVWRFTDGEFKKFKQVAVLGIRKRRDMEPSDVFWLEQYTVDPAAIPSLTELPEDRYALPAQPLEVPVFKGEKFNLKHPLLPLSIGQIGLIGGSGMINGLIECDSPHVIKGRIVKVVSTEVEDQFTSSGNHYGAIERQVISNKMIFNILTPQGFRALT